jgi:hypothetical protein
MLACTRASVFLAYFFLFWKIRVSLWDHVALSVSVSLRSPPPPYVPSTFVCLNQSLWNCMYTMGAEPISYFINPSQQSVSVCVPPIIVKQRLGENVTARSNTHAAIEELFGATFSIRLDSYQRNFVDLCIPLSLLGNGSVNTFPRQRRIVRGSVFYVVRVVSNESNRLVLPRSSSPMWYLSRNTL